MNSSSAPVRRPRHQSAAALSALGYLPSRRPVGSRRVRLGPCIATTRSRYPSGRSCLVRLQDRLFSLPGQCRACCRGSRVYSRTRGGRSLASMGRLAGAIADLEAVCRRGLVPVGRLGCIAPVARFAWRASGSVWSLGRVGRRLRRGI